MVDQIDCQTAPQTGGADIRTVLFAAAFAGAIGEEALRRLRREMHERHVESGADVAWKGDVVEHWAVVIDGMVKIEAAAADGRKTTLLGIAAGGWPARAGLDARTSHSLQGRAVCALTDQRRTGG